MNNKCVDISIESQRKKIEILQDELVKMKKAELDGKEFKIRLNYINGKLSLYNTKILNKEKERI